LRISGADPSASVSVVDVIGGQTYGVMFKSNIIRSSFPTFGQSIVYVSQGVDEVVVLENNIIYPAPGTNAGIGVLATGVASGTTMLFNNTIVNAATAIGANMPTMAVNNL